MDSISVLPAGPLTTTDAETVRAREDVDLFVLLDSPAEMETQGGAREAAALVDGTLSVVRLTERGWSEEVHSKDAERVDLLEVVMKRLSEARTP